LKDLGKCSLRSAEENVYYVYSNLSSEILFSHGYKCIRGTNEKKKRFLTVAISTCVPGLIFRNEFH